MIVGSLPDVLIVLFSGLGPDAQHQLDVGIGAMVGSAVLLTTVAWFLTIVVGRVSIDPSCGALTYKASKKLAANDFYGLNNCGVHVDGKVNRTAWIMIITCTPYILLQGPGLFISGTQEEIAEMESGWALAGLIVCAVFFVGYLLYQFYASDEQEEFRNGIIVEAIRTGKVSLLGVMKAELGDVIAHHWKEHQALQQEQTNRQQQTQPQRPNRNMTDTECTALLQSEHEEVKKKLNVLNDNDVSNKNDYFNGIHS